jgi:hypothetical protein
MFSHGDAHVVSSAPGMRATSGPGCDLHPFNSLVAALSFAAGRHRHQENVFPRGRNLISRVRAPRGGPTLNGRIDIAISLYSIGEQP